MSSPVLSGAIKMCFHSKYRRKRLSELASRSSDANLGQQHFLSIFSRFRIIMQFADDLPEQPTFVVTDVVSGKQVQAVVGPDQYGSMGAFSSPPLNSMQVNSPPPKKRKRDTEKSPAEKLAQKEANQEKDRDRKRRERAGKRVVQLAAQAKAQ